MNLFIKLILTALIVLLGIHPYLSGSDKPGMLDEVFRYGLPLGISFMLAFLILVALYCKSIQTTLTLIKPENRKAKPTRIWQMFIIPYNIIEDFFIMDYVSKSIKAEAHDNPKLSSLKDDGFITGIGWCIAQVLSFIPNEVGMIAGVVALMLWVKHWYLILKVNRLLKT